MSEGGAAVIGWYGWYAILRKGLKGHGTLIAAGGFLGLPSESGVVEIGYSVMEDWRSQGYATEMVNELVNFAFEDPRVRRIVAHTTHQNPASCKVLEHAGFIQSSVSPDISTIEFELHRVNRPVR